METSVSKITVELLSLQAEQDPAVVGEKLGEISAISDLVDKDIGHTSIIGLYLKQFQISVLFQQMEGFDEAL